MTIKELIEKLQEFPEDREVAIIYDMFDGRMIAPATIGFRWVVRSPSGDFIPATKPPQSLWESQNSIEIVVLDYE